MAGHRRPVVWSRDARADLANIWDFYLRAAGHGPAETIVRDIWRACRLLEDHPLAGRDRSEIRAKLRSVSVNPQVVFYRLDADGGAEIVRVLDGRMDLDEIFS